MRLLVIYNPKAGAGRGTALLESISSYLEAKQFKVELQLTEYKGHATELAAGADLSLYDAVITCGGDGTQFEVLNGYYQNKSTKKPPLGLIPNGTGNAFMKELGFEKTDWKQAIDVISLNKPKSIDVGRFMTDNRAYYFLNIVGMGFVSQVAQAAVPLKWMGNVSYTLATLRSLIGLKSQKILLELDGRQIERENVFVEVANSVFTGTHFLMAPKAKLDDGLLDVILLNKISRFKLLRVFTSIYDGSHIHYPEVEYFQAKKIKIIEHSPTKLAPDGEILGETPVVFECLHKDLRFLWRAM